MTDGKYVTLAEVRDLLTAENDKRELLSSQKAAMEQARTVSPLTVEQAKALVAEVSAVPNVTDYTAVKIADILPKYPDDVRAIFAKERVNLDTTTVKQILDIVAKYL